MGWPTGILKEVFTKNKKQNKEHKKKTKKNSVIYLPPCWWKVWWSFWGKEVLWNPTVNVSAERNGVNNIFQISLGSGWRWGWCWSTIGGGGLQIWITWNQPHGAILSFLFLLFISFLKTMTQLPHLARDKAVRLCYCDAMGEKKKKKTLHPPFHQEMKEWWDNDFLFWVPFPFMWSSTQWNFIPAPLVSCMLHVHVTTITSYHICTERLLLNGNY